ncbi:MAG: 2-hydroxyacid dehydrogenase [Chloroflexota bacterium]|nr:2-hydroxyacid dehydrogenase [Chloroflexota bacterium]
MNVAISGRFDEQVFDRLKRDWQIIRLVPQPPKWRLSEEELIGALVESDVLVTEGDQVTAGVLASSPRLKAVIVCKGNPVNVDLAAATAEGVMVVNTPGRNAHAVAELCISLMVMVARKGWASMEAVRSGKWANSPRVWAYLTFQGYELAGRTVGLVGLGAIGRLMAKRLNAFEMRVLAYDPYVSQAVADTLGVQLVSLDELLREADFVSMHVHVTDGTRGMIGAREFALMKPTAFFINTGRAGVVVEEAMIDALHQKRITGAAFDVYHTEPLPADHPLLGLSNVVATSHIGGATFDVVRRMSQIAESDLVALHKGEVPPHLFNSDVLQSPDLRMSVKVVY